MNSSAPSGPGSGDSISPLPTGDAPAPAPGGDGPSGGPDLAGWHPLPVRGARLAAIGPAVTLGLLATLALGVGGALTGWIGPWIAPVGGGLAALAGARIGIVRHRRVRWRLDEDGLAVRRGRWWETETRVPISRVQHVDLRRGPLERSLALATLVVHTAGVKLAAVSLAGLDTADAERLRDRLARRQALDDDAL